jgi:hypothetical protein
MASGSADIAHGGSRHGVERRGSAQSLRWPERRTGFDRRDSQSVTKALRDNVPLLVGLVIVLNVLNIIDFALTSRALELGALEANPVMDAIFMSGWQNAALFKIGSMVAVSATILALRRYRRVLQVAVAAVALYSAIVLYHLVGMTVLG